MQVKQTISTHQYILAGLFVAAALTAVIGFTAANLSGFQIIGNSEIAFAYPWRLAEPNAAARLTAWGGYLLHNLIAWVVIYLAQREKPKFSNDLRWFNWALIATNLIFIALHILQTQFYYDGLAQDVPEITALGSVAVMLMIIILFETPRRGLIFGKKFKFKDGFLHIARKYHGYFFAWATIYTFWYHPTEGTWGHLMGFLYMFMLFVQSTLIFNRSHINRWWMFFLEIFVIIHGVTVAVLQGTGLWPMFAFGFGAMIVLTQMYGLGLDTWAKRGIGIGFIVIVVAYYALSGNIGGLNEVIRIPIIDFAVIFLLYGIYLVINWIINVFKSPAQLQTGTD
jgi:uncharacterized membrane protein YhdT